MELKNTIELMQSEDYNASYEYFRVNILQNIVMTVYKARKMCYHIYIDIYH